MSDECANPLLLEFLKEWWDVAKERSTKSAAVYKKAYESMKACPLTFNHPSEAQQLMGVGPKVCDRLTEKMKEYCQANGLEMPKLNRKSRKRLSADELSAIHPLSPAKKTRPHKPYVPVLRSGPYAIILALSALSEDNTAGLTKAQIIDRAQDDCDASFTAPADTSKYHTAWDSIKTLQKKDLVYEKGRPLRRYLLTDEGWEVAKRIKAVMKGDKQPTYPEAIVSAQSNSTTRNARTSSQPERVSDFDARSLPPAVYLGRNFDAVKLHGAPRRSAATRNASAAPQSNNAEALPRPLGIYPGRDFDAARLHGVPRNSALSRTASTAPQPNNVEALPQPNGVYPGRDFDAARLHGVPRNPAVSRIASAAPQSQHSSDFEAFPRPLGVYPGRDFDTARLHGVPRNPAVSQNSSTVSPSERFNDSDALLQPWGGYTGGDRDPALLDGAIASFLGGFDITQLHRRVTSGNDADALHPPRRGSPPPKGTELYSSIEKGQRLGGAVTDKFGTFSESRVREIPAQHDIVEIVSSPERPQRVQRETVRKRSSPKSFQRAQGDTTMRSSPEPPRWAEKDALRMGSSLELVRRQRRDMVGSQLCPNSVIHPQGSGSSAQTGHKEREPPKEVVCPVKASTTFPAFQPIKLQPGSFTVQLIMDIREVRSKDDRDYIQDELVKKGIKAIIRPLDLGDFLWVARCNDPNLLARLGEEGDEVMLDWIVERKRLDDLIGSIKDGRFHEQKFRLRKTGIKNVIYIIEEFSVSSERMINFQEAIESSIASTQVVDGYFIKKTQKLDDTIRYLARMTVMLKSIYESQPIYIIPTTQIQPQTYLPLLSHLRMVSPHISHNITYASFASLASKSDSLTLRDVFLKMLMCTRGITGDKALEIQKCWKTPRAFFEALEDCAGKKERDELLEAHLGGKMGRKKIGKAVSGRIAEIWGEA